MFARQQQPLQWSGRKRSARRTVDAQRASLCGSIRLSPSGGCTAPGTQLGRVDRVPSHQPTPPAQSHRQQVPQRLLMGPGPANADPRVLAAQSLPLLGHMHPPFLKIMGGSAGCATGWMGGWLPLAAAAAAAAAGQQTLTGAAPDTTATALNTIIATDEISEGLRYTLQTDSKYTLMVSGTGHAGEARGLRREA
jgi:hypothetical protein